VQFTRFRSDITDSYERRYPQVQIDERTDKPAGSTSVTWSGRSRTVNSGGLAAPRTGSTSTPRSARASRDSTSRGITGSFGLGTKLYSTNGSA